MSPVQASEFGSWFWAGTCTHRLYSLIDGTLTNRKVCRNLFTRSVIGEKRQYFKLLGRKLRKNVR